MVGPWNAPEMEVVKPVGGSELVRRYLLDAWRPLC
jgi:hypothetical protein